MVSSNIALNECIFQRSDIEKIPLKFPHGMKVFSPAFYPYSNTNSQGIVWFEGYPCFQTIDVSKVSFISTGKSRNIRLYESRTPPPPRTSPPIPLSKRLFNFILFLHYLFSFLAPVLVQIEEKRWMGSGASFFKMFDEGSKKTSDLLADNCIAQLFDLSYQLVEGNHYFTGIFC